MTLRMYFTKIVVRVVARSVNCINRVRRENHLEAEHNHHTCTSLNGIIDRMADESRIGSKEHQHCGDHAYMEMPGYRRKLFHLCVSLANSWHYT